MAFCKICVCGQKVVFERRLGYPDNCPSCGRKMSEFITYSEDDPKVAELMSGASAAAQPAQAPAPTPATPSPEPAAEPGVSDYVLVLSNGKMIPIPPEGCIIGRTETGAEELAEFPSVSRQHIKLIPKRAIGVILEDVSTYGTLVNGKRLIKNQPVRITKNTKITLCNVEATLIAKEERA